MHDFEVKHSTILTYMVAALIAILLAVIACGVGNRTANNISLKPYASSDVTYADGTTYHTDSTYFGTLNDGDSVVVHVALPEDLKVADSALCFAIYHSVTEVWWGDRLLAAHGAEIDRTGNMVGNEHVFAPVPDEAWGSELTVKLRATENNAFARINTLKIYPSLEALNYFIDADPIGFYVSVPVLFMAVILIVLILIFSIKSRLLLRNFWAVLFALLAALYIFTSDGFERLIGLDAYIWTQLEFAAVITLTYPLTMFTALSATSRRFKTVAYSLFSFDLLFFTGATILHVTNILHYCALLKFAHLITMLNALLIGTYVFHFHGESKLSSELSRIGVTVMALCGGYEVLRTSIPTLYGMPLRSTVHLSLLTLIICIILTGILDMLERVKKNSQAEYQLRELRRMFSIIPAGICQVVPDQDLTIVAANDLFYDIIGYRPKALALDGEKAFFAKLSSDQKLLFDGSVNTILNAPDNTGGFEFSIVDDNGSTHAMMARYFHDREGNGNITVSIVDITERKRMEEELRLSEERYRLALAQSGKVFFFFDVATRTMFLSEDLAKAFGLPQKVGNMPDNLIAAGLVEPRSVENYRAFYERIYAGEPDGDTIISCHMQQTPETVLWYRISFVSVFNKDGKPTSSIITYEDLQEERSREIKSAWKQFDIIATPDNQYAMDEYNLTQDLMTGHAGGLFPTLPEGMHRYSEINQFALKCQVHPDDVETCHQFSDRQRILAMFENGKNEDRCEYRSMQESKEYRWTMLHIQIIRDPYCGDVLAQFMYKDIDEEKTGAVMLRQDMEKLKSELEKSRIRVMINQMQPHFLYNALASIQMIIKRDPNLAYSLLHDFTVHLRSSIKALSTDDAIPFEEEMTNIQAYLNIEKMRFGSKLKVNYEIASEDFEVIPLTIQPLVENAVKHGVYPRGKAGGNVTVRSYETDSAYVVEVEDDGVGFEVEKTMETNVDSYGLKNLVFRIKSILKADVVIKSKLGTGTLVTILIPKNEEKRTDQ